MSIDTTTGSDHVRVAVIGEIDMSSHAQLAAALDAAIALAGAGNLIVDLSAVSFMDSTGIRVLIDAKHLISKNGGQLNTIGANGIVATILKVTGVYETLNAGETDPPPTAA